jgi:hypothetical protein
MSKRIENIEDLRAEIQLLKFQKAEHELYFVQKRESIKKTFSSPFDFFRNVKSFLKGKSEAGPGNTSARHDSDWTTAIARVVVPFLLSKTILRGNGLMIKSLLGLISQKAISGETFNKVKISGWIDKATHWVNSTLKKSEKRKRVDYGIPPDSETY